MKTIDVATKIITPEQKIWLIYPGKRRKYYDIFSKQNMVFLDMPRLELKESSLDSIEKIRQHIRMSKAFRKYYHPDSPETKAPSSSTSAYSNEAGDDVKGDVGNVIALFKNASVGDLVIVTGQGPYENVLMGEIASDFNPEDKIRLDEKSYGEVQYRKVKWTSKKYARKDFERELAERRLINRKAVISIERDAITEKIYKYAYESYIISGTNSNGISKVDFEGMKYTGHDPRETISSINLISYLQAAYSAILKDELDQFTKTSDLETAINKWIDPELVESFSMQFNSPGRFRLLTPSSVFLGFLILGVAAFTSDVAAEEFKQSIKIENSKSKGENEDFQKSCEKFQELLASLDHDMTCKLKHLGTDAKHKIGLKTQAKVK